MKIEKSQFHIRIHFYAPVTKPLLHKPWLFIKAIVYHLDTFMSEHNISWYQIDSKYMYVMKELWTKKFLNYFEDADEIFIQLASGDTKMQILTN